MRSTVQKPQYHHLRKKWTARHNATQKRLLQKHKDAFQWLSDSTKQLTAGALSSVLLLSSPIAGFLPPKGLSVEQRPFEHIDKSMFLITDLSTVLPSEVRALTAEEEQTIAELLSRDFGIHVSAVLDEKRLNRTYGLIGAEQHLARYPGDFMFSHFSSDEEVRLYQSSGMAPGLGAWGYFASSRSQMSEKDALREKYYIAVQTFLSDDFIHRFAEYRDFFKYRKMLVVNPHNGNAIVAVIGDAGPAVWTGKHLGGSPEVMYYLQRKDGKQRGPVLYFFIDDPKDAVPLGPINVK